MNESTRIVGVHDDGTVTTIPTTRSDLIRLRDRGQLRRVRRLRPRRTPDGRDEALDALNAAIEGGRADAARRIIADTTNPDTAHMLQCRLWDAGYGHWLRGAA